VHTVPDIIKYSSKSELTLLHSVLTVGPLNSKYIIYTVCGTKVSALLHNLSMYDVLPSSLFEGK